MSKEKDKIGQLPSVSSVKEVDPNISSMPFRRTKRAKNNLKSYNQSQATSPSRVPTWPLSPDDARLEQETNEDALDRLMYGLNFHEDGSAEKASLQGQIDVLNDRIAADSGLQAYAVRQFRGVTGVDQSLLDVANWEVVPGGEMLTPQQTNCDDCGVFTCMGRW